MRWKKVFFLEIVLLLLVLVVFIVNLNFISAEIYLGNLSHSIESRYTSSEFLEGWINVSFNETFEDILISGFDSEISLKDFLDVNNINCETSGSCSCFPSDCESSYSVVGNGLASQNYEIGFAETELIGIKLVGNISEINNFTMNISTNAKKSCIPPLMIDLFDDGEVDWKPNVPYPEECDFETPYGCFESSHSTQNAQLGTDKYCSVITVPSMIGFEVGAVVQGSGEARFKLDFETAGDQDSCYASTSHNSKIGCVIDGLDDWVIEGTEATVCISAAEPHENPGAAGTYFVNFETNEPCTESGVDFEIYAKPLKYSPVDNLVFDQKLFGTDGFNLNSALTDYITNRVYNGVCDPECIVPIRFYSGSDQNLIINSLFLDYKVDLGDGVGLDIQGSDTSEFYSISKSPVVITTDFLKLDLDSADFSVPSSVGEHNLILSIGDKTINENITVSNATNIIGVFPNKAVYLVPVTFRVMFESNPSKNLTYTWNFGDNATVSTDSNEVEHTYSTMGSFLLKVDISSSTWTKTITANVEVQNPYQAINETIIDYNQKLDVVISKLNTLSGWIKDEIDAKVGIQELRDSVGSLERKYKETPESYDEDHRDIMSSLLLLDIPIRLDSELILDVSKFIQNEGRMDLSTIESELAGSSFEEGRKGDYYKAITLWQGENLDIKWNSKDYYLYFEGGRKELIFTYAKLTLTSKEIIDNFYMILDGDIDEIRFKSGEDYEEDEIEGIGFGFDYNFETIGETKTIEFIYPTIIEPLNAPVYYSPEFSSINLEKKESICNADGICDKDKEDWKNCRVDCSPWGWTFIFLGILLFVALIVYVALQEWYKRNYESRLFKSKNELFNLITFMSNGVNQKLKKGQIMRSLKPMGWSNEQLAYAWKKYKGKRTGMWEIPIFKTFENKKVKKEIDKRKGVVGGGVGSVKSSDKLKKGVGTSPSK